MTDPVQPSHEEPEPVEPDSPDEEPAPLNRAARRAKARKADPTHVGPRADLARQTRGGPAHPKRRR